MGVAYVRRIEGGGVAYVRRIGVKGGGVCSWITPQNHRHLWINLKATIAQDTPGAPFSGVEIDDARESRGPSEAILAAGMGNLAA